jgi:DNA-binding response OmpR family regulator
MAKVLLIDDGKDIRTLLREALSGAGYSIVEASDGAAGLDLAASDRPDIVVLDLVLPGLSGWDVIRRMRANPTLAQVPILAISAESHESMDGDDAYLLGCNSFMRKPVKISALIAEIGALVQKHGPAVP